MAKSTVPFARTSAVSRAFVALGAALAASCGGNVATPTAGHEGNVATPAAGRETDLASCRERAHQAAPAGASLEVVVLGSGGPVPSGRACASHAVLVDGVPRVLVDAGPGSAVRFGDAGLDAGALDAVLLTHLHVDHAGDLPGVVKARDLAHDGPLSFFVAGPGGRGEYPATSALLDALFGARGAYAYLRSFRNALAFDAHDLPIARDEKVYVVRDAQGVRITAVATDHGDAPAVAYRIDHAGRSVVFGGDTTLSGGAVTKLAEGADLLVANATVPDEGAPAPLLRLHATPRRIAEVARDARVGAVVLAHLGAAVVEREPEVVASMRGVHPAGVTFARDCMRVPVVERGP